MTGAEYEHVKRVLLACLDSTEERRTRILAQEPPHVRQEVQRLLQFGLGVSEPLTSPPLRPTTDQPVDAPGSWIQQRYRLEEAVGAGMFGTVWRAYDDRMQRYVALKILQHGVLSEALLSAEVRALEILVHPGIAAAFDSGRLPDGRCFLVTRFVEGQTITQLVRQRGRISSNAVRRWGIGFAEALGAAHEKGVLHLDLKPDNLMIENLGSVSERAVILDFGTGRLLEQSPGSHAADTRRRDRPPAIEDDLRALGSLLFFALTGFELRRDTLAKAPDRRWRIKGKRRHRTTNAGILPRRAVQLFAIRRDRQHAK